MFGNFRINGMLSQLDETAQARNQLERTIYQLFSDLQAARGRIDTQASEIVLLSKELKGRLLKSELDSRMCVSNNSLQYGHFTVFCVRNLFITYLVVYHAAVL